MKYVGLPLVGRRAVILKSRQMGFTLWAAPDFEGMDDEEALQAFTAWRAGIFAQFEKQGYALEPARPYDPMEEQPVSQHLRELRRMA